MANFLKKMLPYGAGALAGGLASQFSALKPFSSAISAGAGALANSDNRLQGALQGFAGGGAGSAIGSGIMGMFGKQGAGATSNFGSNAWQGLKDYTGSIPGFKGVGTSTPTGAMAKFFSPAAQTPASSMGNGIQTKGFVNKLYDPTRTGGQNALGTGVPPQSPTGAKSPMDVFKGLLPGMLTAGAGNLLSPGPSQSPDYSGIQEQLKQQVETNPAMLAAQGYNTSIINGGGIQDAADTIALQTKALEDQRKEALRQNDYQFAANMGGNYIGNSDYQRAVANINNQYDTTKTAMLAQSSAQTERLNMANKQAAASALQGLSAQQIEYYSTLAGLSIAQLQEQFQLDAGRAKSLSDIAKYAGEMMMQSQLPQGKVAA